MRLLLLGFCCVVIIPIARTHYLDGTPNTYINDGRGSEVPVFVDVHSHPKTGFSCEGKQAGNYYADPETNCAVYYICLVNEYNRLSAQSFACPNGTLFNQATRVCSPHDQVYCALSTRYYDSVEGNIDSRHEVTPISTHNLEPKPVSMKRIIPSTISITTRPPQVRPVPVDTLQSRNHHNQLPGRQPASYTLKPVNTATNYDGFRGSLSNIQISPGRPVPSEYNEPRGEPLRSSIFTPVEQPPSVESRPNSPLSGQTANRFRPSNPLSSRRSQFFNDGASNKLPIKTTTTTTPQPPISNQLPSIPDQPPLPIEYVYDYDYDHNKPSASPDQAGTRSKRSAHKSSNNDAQGELQIIATQRIDSSDFTCNDKIPGVGYADVPNKCRIYHICLPESKGKLKDNQVLCNAGQGYNQATNLCQALESFNCEESEKYFAYRKSAKLRKNYYKIHKRLRSLAKNH